MSTTKGIEVKKDGLTQLQDGCWVLKLKVHPEEMPTSLMTLPMGTRFMAALVEIGDDEEPVVRPKEKRSHTQQAAICCNDPVFQRYLLEKHADFGTEEMTSEDAASYVRTVCGVTSRSELDKDERAAMAWESLWSKFKAWELT